MLILTALTSITGVAGLQWKKHIGQKVHVTLADSHDVSVLASNAEHNSLSATHKSLDGRRVPGDPFSFQNEANVDVYAADAKALMMTEAFNFVLVNNFFSKKYTQNPWPTFIIYQVEFD